MTETKPNEVGGQGEVFFAFLKLGLTSFGGPVAHLGYFHDEFVIRRRWIGAAAYAELVGSASSCRVRRPARWVSRSA